MLFTSLCTFCLNILAQQNVNYERRVMFNLPIKNVESISFKKEDIYIKTVDSLYIITQNGEIKEKNYMTDKNLFFDGIKLYSIEKKIITDETHTIIVDLSEKIGQEKIITKFLTKFNDIFFTCVLDTPNTSYSNYIAKVTDRNELSMFCYIVGIPAGLHCHGDSLYYLYNKSVEGKNGILRIYDVKSGDLITENEIPVINPAGIYIIDNHLYTYSNFSREFVQLTKGGQ